MRYAGMGVYMEICLGDNIGASGFAERGIGKNVQVSVCALRRIADSYR